MQTHLILSPLVKAFALRGTERKRTNDYQMIFQSKTLIQTPIPNPKFSREDTPRPPKPSGANTQAKL
jgi:hypothetical protein